MTDEELMNLVRDDDLKHLGVLFDRYHVKLYNYFSKISHDKTLSEDLVQIVFERIIKSRKSYKGTGTFKGWIFRIARNALMDHYKSIKVKINKNVSVDLLDMTELDEATEKEITLANSKKLKIAMDQLKEEHKEILVLTRFQNLNYKEAAVVIGLSENAVKARVFRAMKSLREIYFNKAS